MNYILISIAFNIIISFLFISNHFLLKPLKEEYKNSALWISISLSTEDIDRSKLSRDLLISQMYRVLINGLPTYIAKLSKVIETCFYLLILSSIALIFLFGGGGNHLFLIVVVTAVITLSTSYLLDKVIVKKKLFKRPIVYYLFYYKNKIDSDISDHTMDSYNSIYFQTCIILKEKIPELIEVYRNYNVFPPTNSQIELAEKGNSKYLFELPQNQKRQFLYWKYTAKWDELTIEQRNNLQKLN